MTYSPTSSPSALETLYSTVSVPNVPLTVALNVGSFSPYTLEALFAVTVTALRVIVNVAAVESVPFAYTTL